MKQVCNRSLEVSGGRASGNHGDTRRTTAPWRLWLACCMVAGIAAGAVGAQPSPQPQPRPDSAAGGGGAGWRINRFGDATEAKLGPGREQREALLVGRDQASPQAHVMHPLALRPGHRYRLRVQLAGDAGGQLQLMVRRTGAPYDVVVQEDVTLDDAGRSVELQWVAYDEPGEFDLRVVPRSPRVRVRVGTPQLEDQGRAPLGGPAVAPFDTRLLGLHLNKFGQYRTVPALGAGLVRIWDMRTNWNHLAPTPEAWKERAGEAWTRLDGLVDVVRRQTPGTALLMTLGQPPAWASASPQATCPYGTGTCGAPISLDAWRDYVETLARRYKGRITHWELWNEADYKRFFVPTVSLVDLAKVASEVLKSVDPANRLISPGFTSSGIVWLDRFLAQGGGRYVDAIGFHWYAPGAPETLAPRIKNVRALMQRYRVENLPLWNTEGAPLCSSPGKSVCHVKGLEAGEVEALPMRFILTMWLEGVSAVGYYTVEGIGGRTVMLFDPDSRAPTQAGTGYAMLGRWLREARVESIEAWGEAGHAVRVRGPEGPAVIVWSEQRDEALRVPSGWAVGRKQTPWSEPEPLATDGTLVVGRVPLRLLPAAR
ncbi:MAG TPA: glycosyl hydrolase [Solimonas sp.]|nr:glycosyl hydrolase [Solimonas sp.]